MSVSAIHPEYKKASSRWDLVQSVIDNDASHWIRTVDPNDKIRSDQYKKDAILTNFTRLTQEGLSGLVFRKPPKTELASQIAYLEEDATGMYFGLEQFTQKAVWEILAKGRFGVLVDMPQENKYEEGGEKLARLKGYNAESIINWNYEDYGNEYKLTLVVLKEDASYIGADGFEWVKSHQYRALRLIEGVYIQEIYNEEEELVSQVMPTDYNGNPLSYIPFVFVGSENNDSCIDPIPLYDLAIVNLGHFRNSADVEETSFISGQAVPVVNVGENSSAEEFAVANPGGIVIGSRKGVVLSGGDFKFAQAQPNILPRELMKDKETQAAAIGARLIAPPGGRETAEGAKIRYGSQNSRLYIITKNVSMAMELALWYAAVYMMESPTVSKFELNDQFYEETVDPNLLTALWLGVDRGGVSVTEVRENMRRAGLMLEGSDPSAEQQAMAIGQMMEEQNNEPPQGSY